MGCSHDDSLTYHCIRKGADCRSQDECDATFKGIRLELSKNEVPTE